MVSLRRFAFLPLLRSQNRGSSVTSTISSSLIGSNNLSHRPFLILSGLTTLTLAQPPYSSTTRAITSCLAASSSMSDQEIDTGYLDAKSAAALDDELMTSPGFTLEQLMELAGLSVAEAAYSVLQEKPESEAPEILIVCGPGNNGGDGLVAARHLVMFGYKCTVVYPKRPKKPHYINLVQQCEDLNIPLLTEMPENFESYAMIIDAIFGFSFLGEPREPFATILKQIQEAQQPPTTTTPSESTAESTQPETESAPIAETKTGEPPAETKTNEPKTESTADEPPTESPKDKTPAASIILAVDVPSGWHVNDGDVLGTGYVPDILVSLTAPKLSAQNYPKRHFVGGRFLPPKLAEKYSVRMPKYPGVAQVMEISRGGAKEDLSWEIGYAEYLKEKEAQLFAEENEARDPSSPDRNEKWREDYAAYLASVQAKQEAKQRQQELVEKEESWRLEYAAYLAQKETNEIERPFEPSYGAPKVTTENDKSFESSVDLR